MILDIFPNMGRYIAIHPGFESAFQFLHSIDPDAFTCGKRYIKGEYVYALAMTGPGIGVSNARLESHKKYIEIQFSACGIDNIGWRSVSKCFGAGDYDSVNDTIYYSDIPDTWFGLVPGMYAIFFPEDAHAPLSVNGVLHTIVIRVRVEW